MRGIIVLVIHAHINKTNIVYATFRISNTHIGNKRYMYNILYIHDIQVNIYLYTDTYIS